MMGLTGKITGAWNNAKGGGVINNGTLILENGIICGNRSDVKNVNVTNASDNTNRTGGAGVYNNGTMTMNGGSISGNISGNYGGGVLNQGSKTFTINGGLISENTAVNSGGGIANFGLVVQNDGQLFNNEAKNGGGVYNMCDGSDEGYKMEQNRLEIQKEKQALIDAQQQVADFKKSLFDMYKSHLELISTMPETVGNTEPETAEEIANAVAASEKTAEAEPQPEEEVIRFN